MDHRTSSLEDNKESTSYLPHPSTVFHLLQDLISLCLSAKVKKNPMEMDQELPDVKDHQAENQENQEEVGLVVKTPRTDADLVAEIPRETIDLAAKTPEREAGLAARTDADLVAKTLRDLVAKTPKTDADLVAKILMETIDHAETTPETEADPAARTPEEADHVIETQTTQEEIAEKVILT